MRMGKHDRLGLQPFKFSEPIESAINHHAGVTIRHQQRAMHAMPPRSCVDLRTRAEKCELHQARESFPSVMRSTRERFRESIRGPKVERAGAPIRSRLRRSGVRLGFKLPKKEPVA